jgi:phosphoribosylglycinamide formyltransferase-1
MASGNIHLAIFASGGGSNARALTNYFKQHEKIKISLFLTNNKESGVISLGAEHHIPSERIPASGFKNPEVILPVLRQHSIDYIILAGFLLHIPDFLIRAYPDKILNIHPSLLPKFGGKGMYGHHVHEAVWRAGEKTTGCTIHLVNENYDEGRILCQFETSVENGMEPSEIAREVLVLEHRHYGPAIEKYISDKEF